MSKKMKTIKRTNKTSTREITDKKKGRPTQYFNPRNTDLLLCPNAALNHRKREIKTGERRAYSEASVTGYTFHSIIKLTLIGPHCISCHAITQYHPVSPSITQYHPVSPSITQYYPVLPSDNYCHDNSLHPSSLLVASHQENHWHELWSPLCLCACQTRPNIPPLLHASYIFKACKAFKVWICYRNKLVLPWGCTDLHTINTMA